MYINLTSQVLSRVFRLRRDVSVPWNCDNFSDKRAKFRKYVVPLASRHPVNGHLNTGRQVERLTGCFSHHWMDVIDVDVRLE